MATGAIYRQLNHVSTATVKTAAIQAIGASDECSQQTQVLKWTSRKPRSRTSLITIISKSFRRHKQAVADAAENFKTDGWQVSVEGLVNNPQVFDLDSILKISPPEERIYRMRCVEGWSMVVPWAGYSLSKLLEVVEPTEGEAKYVAFETLLDSKRIAGTTESRCS